MFSFGAFGELAFGEGPRVAQAPEPPTPAVPFDSGGIFPRQRPRIILPPILGIAFSGQGGQSVDAQFGLRLSAKASTLAPPSWVDAVGALTANAVGKASQRQTVITHFWPKMTANIRLSQDGSQSAAGMGVRVDLIGRSGGDAMIIPSYSGDPLPEPSFNNEDDVWA